MPLFNTSGMEYRALGLKDRLASMSEEEQLALLATSGMLVSFRPKARYSMPEVLKNFFSGRPLCFHQARSSSWVGFSSLILRTV